MQLGPSCQYDYLLRLNSNIFCPRGIAFNAFVVANLALNLKAEDLPE